MGAKEYNETVTTDRVAPHERSPRGSWHRKGLRHSGITEQLHGAEREESWQQIVTASAQFATYQEKTDRELPVNRLVPRAP